MDKRTDAELMELRELSERMRPDQLRDLREFARRLYASDEEKMQVILPLGVDVAVQRYDPKGSFLGRVWGRWLSLLSEQAGVKLLVPKGVDVVVRHYEQERPEWRFERVNVRQRDHRDDQRDMKQEDRQFRESRRDREVVGDRERIRRDMERRSEREDALRADHGRDGGNNGEGTDVRRDLPAIGEQGPQARL